LFEFEMKDPGNIRIKDYDYLLPAEQIAQYPLAKRDNSRLLVLKKAVMSKGFFTDLPDLLPSESMLVFNDTRVIRARFEFFKTSGARIEIFCLEPIPPVFDMHLAFASNIQSHWKCYVGNLKKWKENSLFLDVSLKRKAVRICAEKTGAEKDTVNVKFTWDDPSLSFSEIMEAAGHIPLPPYIERADEEKDATRYQTIYARHQGSVAAPTAGLHFSEEVMSALLSKGIKTQSVTLHVGAGTFKPVDSEKIGLHEMHYEHYAVSRDIILALIDHIGKPLIPVGTTSMRTLESLYWLGVKLIREKGKTEFRTGQWEPYADFPDNIGVKQALSALLQYFESSGINTIHASTGLLIAPGYRFRICNGLITNFHLPKSTLLLLVAALIGEDWRKVYQFALENNFRFLSYGDSCLFIP
jgi:S-adenosylmethionine:tRNA ribosyltransferase-isomerase